MVISRNGFRLNVGIIITNQANELLWCRRAGQRNAWQFPQGGIKRYETLKEAMFRELKEELGLKQTDIQYIFSTPKWLYYRLPRQYRRFHSKPHCVGQKQKWFLLRLLSDESCIKLNEMPYPEFDYWRWVDYWYPVEHVIDFKRNVYKKMLTFFAPVLFNT
jgi:putative (di)nucleoside polyphosphate hydrolase